MGTEKSASFLRRQELLESLAVPTISETKEHLGAALAEVVFEQCRPDELRVDLGLQPPLEGAGDELWLSPSDLLEGKLCLKPPFTQKCVLALTHQGILNIGAKIERKYWNEMLKEKQRSVEEREVFLNKMHEVHIKRLTADLQRELHEEYLQKVEELTTFFDGQLTDLVLSLEKEIAKQQLQTQSETEALNAEWERKLEEEVSKTVKQITREFLNKLQKQEEVLVAIYQNQLKNFEMKRRWAVDFERIKCKEAVIQLKHNLECKNVANLMYVLCKERSKCHSEKQALENSYLNDIKSLNIVIKTQAKEIEELTTVKDRKIKQLRVRERCLVEILRQFKKFIYYALRATPTQGEFLMNVEKMMTFELENYCLKEEKVGESPEETEEVRIEENQPPGLEHCLKQETSLGSVEKEIRGESNALPAFSYNKKIYVREDFRDMVAAGVAPDKKLWNKDVEELVKVFKESVAKERENEKNFQITSKKSHQSHYSSVRFPDNESMIVGATHSDDTQNIEEELSGCTLRTSVSIKNPNNSSTSQMSQGVSVGPDHKKKSLITATDSLELKRCSLQPSKSPLPGKDPGKIIVKDSNKSTDVVSIKRSTSFNSAKPAKTSVQHEVFSNWESGLSSKNQMGLANNSKLTLARDSVILRIASFERKSLLPMSSSKLGLLPKPAQGPTKFSGNSSISSLKRCDGLDRTSKLAMHCDSLEIIRSGTQLGSLGSCDKGKSSSGKETGAANGNIQNDRKSIVTFDTKMMTNLAKPGPRTKGAKGASRTNGAKPKVNSKTTPKPNAKVVGSRKTREHLKTSEEFTQERVNSLLKLMRGNASLIRLFTAVTR